MYPISMYTTFHPELIEEYRQKISIFTVNSQLKKGGKNEVLLSQFVANCSASMDSTQSRLDLELKEYMDSLHLPLCAKQSLKIIFCYSCQSSWES